MNMKKILVMILFAIAGTTVLPSDAQAYWHGRYWGGGGFYHPGWGCGWRCGGPGWAERGWVGPAVVAGAVGAAVVAAPSLPEGCVLAPRNQINFYQCPGFRVRPLYGKNGLFYRVVPE
jgi:hypothetical protein